MKRLLPLVLLFASLAFLQTPAGAQGAEEEEVNFDFFYEQLQAQGDWFQTEQYGYVFQPKVAGKENWRPYSDGYWSYTDQGWAWVSYEDFGWATYHYGRWAKLADYGWVWVPGYEWAPAWVSWRTSSRVAEIAGEEPPAPEEATDVADNAVPAPGGEEELIGWAPLPPEAVFDDSVGFTSAVDETYDIGPSSYCFVPTAYFAAPVLTAVILPVARNVFFVPRTVNCTNLGYHGRRGGHGGYIYSGGPRFRSIERRVTRPIPVLTIQRTPPGNRTRGVQAAPPIMNQVRGNTLQVVAPRIVRPPGVRAGAVGVPASSAAGVRPANIRGVIPRVERQRGWENLDPQAVTLARTQIRREAASAPPRAAAPQAMPAVRPRDPNSPARVAPALPVGPEGRTPAVIQPEPRTPRQAGPGQTRTDRSLPSEAVREQLRRQDEQRRRAAEATTTAPQGNPAATAPAQPQRDRAAAAEIERRRALQSANEQLRDPNVQRQQADQRAASAQAQQEAAQARIRQQQQQQQEAARGASTQAQQDAAAQARQRQQQQETARATSAQAQYEAAQARIRQQQQQQQDAARGASAQAQQEAAQARIRQQQQQQQEAARGASAQAQQEAAQARIRQQQQQGEAQREAAAAQQREAAIARQAQQAEAAARAQAQREAVTQQRAAQQQAAQQRAQQAQADAAARAQAQREAAAAAAAQQRQQQQPPPRRPLKPGEPTPAPN